MSHTVEVASQSITECAGLLEAAAAMGAPVAILPELVIARLHPTATAVCQVVIQDAVARPNVNTVASRLGCSGRQLQRAFSQAGLPSPHRLIVLTRWLAVAGRLGDRQASRKIAKQLGFSSTQAFCKAAVREVRAGIVELRREETAARILADLITAYQAPLIPIPKSAVAD